MSISPAELIKRVRAAKSQKQENTLIETELANIRTSLKQRDQPHIGRNVAKIVYAFMRGYSVSWGYMAIINLCSSAKNHGERRIAYLALSLLMSESTDYLRMATNSIKTDLESGSQYRVSVALAACASVATADMLSELSPCIASLSAKADSVYLRKKALIVSVRCVELIPEASEVFIVPCVQAVNDKSHAVVLGGSELATAILRMRIPGALEQLNSAMYHLAKVLANLNVMTRSGEHMLGNVSDPLLQVSLLTLFRVFIREVHALKHPAAPGGTGAGASVDAGADAGLGLSVGGLGSFTLPDPTAAASPIDALDAAAAAAEAALEGTPQPASAPAPAPGDGSAPLELEEAFVTFLPDVLENVVSTGPKKGESVPARVSIQFEAARTILQLPSDIFGANPQYLTDLRGSAADALTEAIAHNNQTVRYSSLSCLAEVVAKTGESSGAQRHRGLVLQCMREPSTTLRRRALSLLVLLVDEDSVEGVVSDLLLLLGTRADGGAAAEAQTAEQAEQQAAEQMRRLIEQQRALQEALERQQEGAAAAGDASAQQAAAQAGIDDLLESIMAAPAAPATPMSDLLPLPPAAPVAPMASAASAASAVQAAPAAPAAGTPDTADPAAAAAPATRAPKAAISIVPDPAALNNDIRDEIIYSVSFLIDRFSTDPKWHFDTLFQLQQLATAGRVNKELISSTVAHVQRNADLQGYACQCFYNVLYTTSVDSRFLLNETILTTSLYVVGEFVACVEDVESVSEIVRLIDAVVANKLASGPVKRYAVSAYAKIAVKIGPKSEGVRRATAAALERMLLSSDVETQQRAYEYLLAVGEPKAAGLLGSIPTPPRPQLLIKMSELPSRAQQREREREEELARQQERMQAQRAQLRPPPSRVAAPGAGAPEGADAGAGSAASPASAPGAPGAAAPAPFGMPGAMPLHRRPPPKKLSGAAPSGFAAFATFGQAPAPAPAPATAPPPAASARAKEQATAEILDLLGLDAEASAPAGAPLSISTSASVPSTPQPSAAGSNANALDDLLNLDSVPTQASQASPAAPPGAGVGVGAVTGSRVVFSDENVTIVVRGTVGASPGVADAVFTVSAVRGPVKVRLQYAAATGVNFEVGVASGDSTAMGKPPIVQGVRMLGGVLALKVRLQYILADGSRRQEVITLPSIL